MSGSRGDPPTLLFDPTTLRLLGQVFDSALQNVVQEPALNGLRGHTLRQALAHRIIARARCGERNPERLRAAVIADLGRLASLPFLAANDDRVPNRPM